MGVELKAKSDFKHRKNIPNISIKLKKYQIGPLPKKPKKFKSNIDRLLWQLRYNT